MAMLNPICCTMCGGGGGREREYAHSNLHPWIGFYCDGPASLIGNSATVFILTFIGYITPVTRGKSWKKEKE